MISAAHSSPVYLPLQVRGEECGLTSETVAGNRAYVRVDLQEVTCEIRSCINNGSIISLRPKDPSKEVLLGSDTKPVLRFTKIKQT